MFDRKLLPALTVLILGAPHVFAEEVFDYGAVGAWSVRIDPSLDYGCFLFVEFEEESLLRLGVDPIEGGLYLLVGDPDWQSIDYGKTYAVQLYFGDETPWTADASGFSFDPPEDQPFLEIIIDTDPDNTYLFMTEFMQEANMNLHYNGSSIMNLSLRDSYEAGMKLFECQEAANSALRKNSDPFASPDKSNAKDPFADT
jgi:hypothetical protein